MKIEQNIIIDPSTVKEMEDEVFNNVKAHAHLRKLGLDDQTIKDNIAKIYDFAVDVKNCKDCKGIKFCNKEPKYLVNSVTFKNGIVDRTLIPCKKYLEYTNFKKSFVVADFDEDWLDNSIGKSISNLNSKPKMSILKQYKQAYNGESQKWIFIKGGIASGKSFYAATLCVDAAKNGFFEKIAFINVSARFKELADYLFTKNPKFDSEIEKYQSCDLLVLDDFGNEFKSDFVRDNILFPILSYRVKNKKFTIITSNYSIEDLAGMYLTSNASKPKIEQIRQMLKMMCGEESTLLDPSFE